MQGLTLDAVVQTTTVQIISQQRKTNMRKMDSDLVSSTSMQVNINQMNISIRSYNLVRSMGILSAFSYSPGDNGVFITRNWSNDFSLWIQVSITFNQSKVTLFNRLFLQLLV